MEFDLVVRGGRVVNGSGEPSFQGDVAVVDDRIVAVGEVEGSGREEIDAAGLVVAPGFVDGHTHMDAQVFWDQLGTSSCWQGITTVVMGNCGYTLAPTHERDRVVLARHVERAEEIPMQSMELAIPFGWSTYPEFLDAVDGLPKGINYAGSIGHSALRLWAMGERAFDGPASEEEVEVMWRELQAALAAGATGFSTTRNPGHTTSDDRPVASRMAAWSEVEALVKLMGREGRGVFQTSGQPGRDYAEDKELTNFDHARRLQKLALESGVSTVFAVGQYDDTIKLIEAANMEGGEMWGLTHCRGVGIMQSFETKVAFDILPEWKEVRTRPLDEQAKLFRDPQVRERLIQAVLNAEFAAGEVAMQALKPDYDKTTIMYSPYRDNPTVAEEARRRGVSPVEAMIDVALEQDFKIFFPQILGFQTPSYETLVNFCSHPNLAMTFSDAGAHVTQVADCSIQTHLLAYWVRERQAISLEQAIWQVTAQPAKMWRLRDRGRLAPGYAADITIFDADTVAPCIPEVVHDLPGGLRRLEQRAVGYHATIVNGEVFIRDGEPTEIRPGRLLRANRIPVPAA
jgi:N-acyl-D-amino-acid deacylase